MSRSADTWDEVWDAYEARHFQAEALSASPPSSRKWRWVVLPVGALLLFLAGWVAGSAWPVLNLYGRMAGRDMPSILRLVDLGGARDSVRDALRRQAGLGMGQGEGESAVEKLLATMAEEMADSLTSPGALEGVVLARQEGLLASPHAAAPPLQRLQPATRGLLSFDMGPARGQGGFGLDLAWRGGAWRAVALSLLDPPVARGLEGVRVARDQAALPLAGGRSG